MSTPPKSDPLAMILGSSEWLSRPRAGAKDGAPHPPSSSSPTEREGRRDNLFDRQLEQRGGVWLGHLRVSDEPWRPRAARRAGSLPTRRDERLAGRRAHVEGNSSRDTSLSDDGSGASDGVAEVTFDENTSEHVVGTHDVVHGTSARGHDSRRVHIRASRKSSEDAEAAGGEGDGGSVVGDPETSAEADTVEADTGEIDVATGAARAGVGVANTHARYDSRLSETVHRETNRHDARQQTPSTSAAKRDGVGETRRADSGRRLPQTFSGADYRKRRGSAGEDHSRREDREDVSAPRELFCSLIARPPPAAAGIPGTAGGEGQARALAAGNAMPSTLEARAVRPGAEGWPDAWNPVALLRLFPSVDGLEPLGGDAPASVGGVSSSVSLDAFDALAARLAPEPLGGAGDAEGTAEARGKEEGENAAAAKAPAAAGTSPRKGTETLRVTRHSELTAKALANADAEEGEGEVPPARATRAATRSRAAARAAKGKEAKPKARAEKRKRAATDAAPSPSRAVKEKEKETRDRDTRDQRHATDADDTASIHSGGSMAGAKVAERERTRTPSRSPERSSSLALRVDLEGGYVAFIVSRELLPEDVRRSVASDEAAKEEASGLGFSGDARRGDGAESKGRTRESSPSTRRRLRDSAPTPAALASSNDSNASGASDDTKELATIRHVAREGVADGGGSIAADDDAVAATNGASGADRARTRDGDEARLRSDIRNRLRRPLWVIVQSDQTETQHDSALQTPVPAPDVQPTRGILRHRHSKPLPPRRAQTPMGDGAMGVGSHGQLPVYEKGLVVDAGGHVVRRAAANPTPATRREAGSAMDERSMRGRRVSRHKRETLDPIADIRDVRGDPDWAVDALALAAAGARNEGLPHILFPMDDGGSSPDVHSGVSSGESSGDEGLSGDEGSDGAVEPALVRRDASRLAVESHAEREAHDMDVDADVHVGADPRGDAGSTPLPGHRPPGALAETARAGTYRNWTHAIRTIAREEGVRGLFRGYWAQNFVWWPWSAAYFMIYDGARGAAAASTASGETSPTMSSACATLAASTATVMTHPLDLAKTRLQTLRFESASSASMRSVLARVVEREGVRGLFAGVNARVAAVAPGSAISFYVYETLKQSGW